MSQNDRLEGFSPAIVLEDPQENWDCKVEQIDWDSGDIYWTMFEGPYARERAEQYAVWLNSGAFELVHTDSPAAANDNRWAG